MSKPDENTTSGYGPFVRSGSAPGCSDPPATPSDGYRTTVGMDRGFDPGAAASTKLSSVVPTANGPLLFVVGFGAVETGRVPVDGGGTARDVPPPCARTTAVMATPMVTTTAPRRTRRRRIVTRRRCWEAPTAKAYR